MNEYILFQNKGLIDKRAMNTFGLSVKNKDNPIGMFGTGLKYAIAVLMRDAVPFRIFSGTEEIHFSTKEIDFRDEKVNMIYIDDKEAGFTTHFGKNWTQEEAFRELYSNCLDEKGTIALFEGGEDLYEEEFSYDQHHTRIYVQSEEFSRLYRNKGELFLDTPVFIQGPMADVHKGQSGFLYYRGVKALKLNRPSKYTYNILAQCDLTEDRTLKYNFQWLESIRLTILTAQDKEFLENILTASIDYMEEDLDFASLTLSNSNLACEEFFDVVSMLRNDVSKRLNSSAYRLWLKYAPHVMNEVHQDKLDEMDNEQFQLAVELCRELGFEVTKFKIVYKNFLGQGVMGLARDKTIFFSQLALDQGFSRVASTLIEEFLHLEHGFDDCSRRFQDFLLDNMVRHGTKYIRLKKKYDEKCQESTVDLRRIA